jgi:hypothetical protein
MKAVCFFSLASRWLYTECSHDYCRAHEALRLMGVSKHRQGHNISCVPEDTYRELDDFASRPRLAEGSNDVPPWCPETGGGCCAVGLGVAMGHDSMDERDQGVSARDASAGLLKVSSNIATRLEEVSTGAHGLRQEAQHDAHDSEQAALVFEADNRQSRYHGRGSEGIGCSAAPEESCEESIASPRPSQVAARNHLDLARRHATSTRPRKGSSRVQHGWQEQSGLAQTNDAQTSEFACRTTLMADDGAYSSMYGGANALTLLRHNFRSLPSKVVKSVWADQEGDWARAVACLSELCGDLKEQSGHEQVVELLMAQFPSLDQDVVRSVWSANQGDEAAIMEVHVA